MSKPFPRLFCYEKDFKGEWCGTVYYEEPLPLKKHDAGKRTQLIDAKELTLDELIAKYPPPSTQKDISNA